MIDLTVIYLRRAVEAKLALWDATKALEDHLVGAENDISDASNNQLIDYISDLAVAVPPENISAEEAEHVIGFVEVA